MKVDSIKTLDEFIDAVVILSESKAEWIVKDYMAKINNIIVNSLKNGQMVSVDVMVAYFSLYQVLGNKASRERIRASAFAVKTWIQETNNNSYGTAQQRELLEN